MAVSSCSANIRETRMAIGYQDQSDLVTPNIAADMISFTKLNDALAEYTPQVETDATWIGKGDEFPTESFLDSWNVQVAVEKYLGSQILGHAAVYGLGGFTYGGGVYTCTPADPVTSCINMKPFSYLETIRQGGSAILDRVFPGMCVEEFQVALGSGPTLASAKITETFVGTGLSIDPSGITQPAISAENLLRASTMTFAMNGVDYVTTKNIVSVQFGFKNNIRLDSGYFPGSGFETPSDATSGQVRGRMEFGDRVFSMSAVARFCNGSTELASLLAQSSGTGVITLSGGAGHSMTATAQKTTFGSATIGNTDGIVTVAITVNGLKDPTNGIFTLAVGTTLVGIGS